GRDRTLHGPVGPAPAAAHPGHHPAAPAHRPGGAAAVPAHAGAVRVLLRLAAPGGVPGPGPGWLLDAAVRGHRQAPLHHRRIPGLAAAGAAGGDLDPGLDAPSGPALGPAAPRRLRHRRAGGAAFLVAGEIRHPRTGTVCRHPRRAARLARGTETQGAPNHSSALSAPASRIAASSSHGRRTPLRAGAVGCAGTGRRAASSSATRGAAAGNSTTNRCWPSNTTWSPCASTASRTGTPLTTLPSAEPRSRSSTAPPW